MFDEAVKKYSTKPKISCPLCRADVFIKAKLSLMEVTHY
jgi:DNA-directed RNA polymerase subunit RPC12/RpoP